MDGLGELPAGEVGQAVVADLAGPDEPVEGAQRLGQRGPGIPGVHLVEVDRVDTEAPQRGVERAGEVARREAALVGARPHREAALGREHDAVGDLGRPGGQPAADDLLGDPGGVDVGGVDEGAARGDEGVELLVRAGLVGLGAERHRCPGRAPRPRSRCFRGFDSAWARH